MANDDFLEDIVIRLGNVSPEEQNEKDVVQPASFRECTDRDALADVDYAQDIFLKKRFAKHVLNISYGWLVFLIFIIIIAGIVNAFQNRPFISDAVLITLVSGTSLGAIVGMVSIILRHLFAGRRQ